MYKKYTTPLPSNGMWGSRKTPWDGPANKKKFSILKPTWHEMVTYLINMPQLQQL